MHTTVNLISMIFSTSKHPCDGYSADFLKCYLGWRCRSYSRDDGCNARKIVKYSGDGQNIDFYCLPYSSNCGINTKFGVSR